MNSSYSQTMATQMKILMLTIADAIYGDDTFYTSPNQLTLLYTLHAMVDKVVYPLVFGLLSGKSEELYDRYFNLLKTTCQHQLHRLQDS